MSKPSIDFGANMLNDTLTVASPFAGANVAVRAEWKCPWLSVAPQQVFTTGPAGPATLTLSVTRALMRPGGNSCSITLKAQGFADLSLSVRADAIVSADFQSSQTTANIGEPITFSDETRVLTGAEPLVSWKWDFGDGASSGEQNPVHAYAEPGVYTVSLSVRSSSGSDVRIRPNWLSIAAPLSPDADFVAASRKPALNMPVQFRDTSIPGETETTGWRWDFGDGGWSLEQNPVHLFTAASVYDVYLTVTNVNATDTAVKLGYIDVQAPTQ